MVHKLILRGMPAKDVKTIIVSDEATSLSALASFVSLYGVKCDARLMDDAGLDGMPGSPADYDFVILDLFELTPVGLDLILSMRRIEGCKPIIIVTNNSVRVSPAALARKHSIHVLRKPLDVSELLRAMETALEHP